MGTIGPRNHLESANEASMSASNAPTSRRFLNPTNTQPQPKLQSVPRINDLPVSPSPCGLWSLKEVSDLRPSGSRPQNLPPIEPAIESIRG